MADTTAELEQFVDLAVPSPPNDTVISTLLSFYPDVASGSPFDTGNNTFGLSPLWKIGTPGRERRCRQRDVNPY
jgi:hypothetical protein